MSTYQRWLQHNKSIQTIFNYDVRNLESLETTTLDTAISLEDVSLSSKENSTDDELFYINELDSGTLAFLIILYATTILGGVLGNASLILSLCSSASVRLRNPLLLSLCFADISVAMFSATSTITTAVLCRQTQWKLSTTLCKILNFLETMPVAASTLSLLMLSFDRYATVKHPRLAQLRQQPYLHATVSFLCWCVALVLNTPILFYNDLKEMANDTDTSNINDTAIHTSPTSTLPDIYIDCRSDYEFNENDTYFNSTHTVFVFIIPAIGIFLNHYGVRRKLCALSLTARAAHGELPLPMPIMRRPTHMIIVTGLPNANRVCNGLEENSFNEDNEDDDDDNSIPMVERSLMAQHTHTNHDRKFSLSKLQHKTLASHPMSPRVMREFRANQNRHKINNHENQTATPGIPLPQTSTLRSRRRLANILVASAFIFIICWAPHVICVLNAQLNPGGYSCSKSMNYFFLLLGYFQSATNPLIYWVLNHNTLRQSPCAPFLHINSIQAFFRKRFRTRTVPPPPSSTNEAALGAFNPKYIKSTPKQYRAQASSQYYF